MCLRCAHPLPTPVVATSAPAGSAQSAGRGSPNIVGPGGLNGWSPDTAALSPQHVAQHRRSVRSGHTVGTVRGFQSRTETTYSFFLRQQRSWIVWTFRVEQFDSQGNVQARTPVELRGLSFAGAISEGDEVELPKVQGSGLTIHPPWVRNHTTGALITAKGVPASQTFVFVIAIVVAVMIAIMIVAQFQQQCAAWRGPNPPPWCSIQRR